MDTSILEKNRRAYLLFNDKKVERFKALLPSSNIIRILDSMLFLLHTNQNRLPGFINEFTPHGIHGFSQEESTEKYLKSLFPTVSFKDKPEKFFIQSVALIGSAGTIAYNKKSDFDFWICIDKTEVPENRLLQFRKKVQIIQAWAEHQLGLEVHLFINDINELKKNIFDEDEEEAFGSTLGALLKDEFYRSSITIAGKVPFWWAVPLETDDKAYQKLFDSIDPSERKEKYIDIGNLHNITKDDFIGAALFQIVKSLGNPFKSILKLGVLEKYLLESDTVELISHKLKKMVLAGKLSNTILDSYLLMFYEVFQYYSKTLTDKSALKILKINLYLKINPSLSKYTSFKDSSRLPYKVLEMHKYTRHWKWNNAVLEDLDSFMNWDFVKVTKFWNEVRRFMLISYQKISRQFVNFDLKSKISESDYKLLSRKIRGYFSFSKDKIERYISFTDTSCESYLYVDAYKDKDGNIMWRLYKKVGEQANSQTNVVLRIEASLIRLLAWSAINGLYQSGVTKINMINTQNNTNTETIELINLMSNLFTSKELKAKNSYYLHEAFPLKNLIVINFFIKQKTSIITVDHLYHSSWGESFHHHYTSPESVIDILFSIISGGVNHKHSFDNYCSFYADDDYKQIVKHIYQLFKRAYSQIVLTKTKNARFISKVSNSYVIITRKGSTVFTQKCDSITHFYSSISGSPVKEIATAIDPQEDVYLEKLNYLLNNAEHEKISIFYETIGSISFIYIFNEEKNIFAVIKPASELNKYLSHIYHFLHSAISNLKIINPFAYIDEKSLSIKELVTAKNGTFQIKSDHKPLTLAPPSTRAYRLICCKNGSYKLGLPDGTATKAATLNDVVYVCINNAVKESSLFSQLGINLIQSVDLEGFAHNAAMTSNLFFREKFRVDSALESTFKSLRS
ncbi:MAG: class I adenylate cyclase [Spirochaetes bacterium]|nr:class I adenylate cyclase [Spirochaetota bacterium]